MAVRTSHDRKASATRPQLRRRRWPVWPPAIPGRSAGGRCGGRSFAYTPWRSRMRGAASHRGPPRSGARARAGGRGTGILRCRPRLGPARPGAMFPRPPPSGRRRRACRHLRPHRRRAPGGTSASGAGPRAWRALPAPVRRRVPPATHAAPGSRQLTRPGAGNRCRLALGSAPTRRAAPSPAWAVRRGRRAGRRPRERRRPAARRAGRAAGAGTGSSATGLGPARDRPAAAAREGTSRARERRHR